MRRTWMLLLALVLTVVVMAVPAMAAENDHTGHDDTWKELTSGTTALTEGKYYLKGDISASITSTSGNIVICLNGQTWNGDGKRPLAVTGGSVTICDCCYSAPSVDESTGAVGTAGGGQLVGYQYSGKNGSGNGGAVNVASDASFTLESGTITGGRAEYGGNIYSKGTVTVSGGVICNGEVGFYGTDNKYESSTTTGVRKGWGGNIDMAGSTLTVSGGVICGGKAGGNGGNIRIESTAGFTMTGGVISGGDSRDNGGNIVTHGDMELTDGLIIAGTANNGGNIVINAGGKTVHLGGVTIKNGVCCGGKNANSVTYTNGQPNPNSSSGGNVRVFNAVVGSMTIDGGTVITGGVTNAANKSKNISFEKDGAVLAIGTCQIDGWVYVKDGCTVNLSGAPVISGGTTNLSVGSNTVSAADMTGGSVGITATGDARAITGTVDAAYGGYFFADAGSGLKPVYDSAEGYKCVWLAESWCVCGDSKNGGNHIRFTDASGNTVGCDGTELPWVPVKNKIPTSSGNYYLTQNIDLTNNGGQYKPAASAVVNLDLNNHSITNGSRVIALNNSNASLTLTDTSTEKGGRVYKANSTYKGQGGLVWINAGARFTMFAGTLEYESTASNSYGTTGCGAVLCVNSSASVFDMYGGQIIGGQAKSATIEGTVYTAGKGGNLWVVGTMNMYAGSVTGGVDESEGNVSGNLYLTGTLNLHGGAISGYVDASGAKAVNIYGGQISGGTTNLYLGEKTITVSNTLADGTDVIVSCDNGTVGTVIASNVTAYNGGIFYQGGQYQVVHNTSDKTLALQAAGALVKGDDGRGFADLSQALAAAKSGDYVCLMADHKGNVSFTGDVYLDLNGYDIAGDVNVSGKLYLLDSATADYTVEDGQGYGTVTGTVTGVVRAFTTAAIRQNYDNHNYRYMVVCVDGKYSAHRIYMTVKSTVLQPQVPGLNYRTVLRCNEYFAQLINEQGGYGIVLNAQNSAGTATYTYGNYVKWGKTIQAYAQVGDEITQENNLVTQLGNILDATSKNSADNQYNAAAKVTARAYIWIDDDLVDSLQDETAGDAAAQKAARSANAQSILANGVLTSAASNSLKDVIQLADEDSKWNTLSVSQKKALGGMYGRWEELMGSWDLQNIPTEADANVQYGCLCGDPDSTGNPCAESGHVEFAWDIWEEGGSLPTVSGNYYLNTDVTLSAQLSVGTDVHINLNTCGHDITAPADRVALVYGIFNLTNYGYDGATVKDSAISGHGHKTNDSGAAMLIESGANVSLYSGVTLKPTDTYDYKNGVVCLSGSLNIYGGNITGGDVTANAASGGTVYVASGADMYMNAGTISGGTALNGGNLHVAGNFTMAGGTIENGVALRDAVDANGGHGGNIYISTSGNVTLRGGEIKNGQAGIDVGGELSYTNTSSAKKGWGGNINSLGTLSIDGATITGGRCGGNGGSVYINGGSFTLESGSLTGGQTNDQGGNLFLNVSATLTGGTLTGGKAANGGNLALGNSSSGVALTLRGVTLTGGVATSKGGNIHAQNYYDKAETSLTIEAGTQITGGSASTGGNIRLNCALNITGGQISGGLPADKDSSNILVDGWSIDISGGTIDGGVHLNANTTARDINLTLTGAPVVTGRGILLQEATGKNLITVTLDTAGLDRENASVVLRTSTFVDDHADGIRLADSSSNEWLARDVLQDMAGFGGSEVTYEQDGIYLKKSTDSSMKWSCKCGANYGETHVNGCDGYDVRYDKWSSKTLPNKPGNWYLSYSTTENAAGVAYVNNIVTGTFGLDYYKDSDGYHSVYTLRAKGTGELDEEIYLTNDSGKYVSVAEYVEKYPDGPSYADEVGSATYSKATDTAYVVSGTAYTAGDMPYTVEKDYTVRIDLNGYKLETSEGSRAFSFRGLADPDGSTGTAYSSTAACRTANVTLDLIDSSQGHTAVIASYGVYTLDDNGNQTLYSNSGTHWQSDMIWMDCTYNPNDKLNACYITLDASTVITGVGPALMVDGGSAAFYGSTVIGGVAQSQYIGGIGGSRDHLSHTNVYGGGAIAVLNSGTLTLDNSTVKNGMSIYSVSLHHENGVMYEQAVGGGNIFVSGGTLNLIDATITGGMALIDSNSEKSRLPSFSYGSGGGVYVLEGKVNISGKTKIYDNFTGTISGTKLTLTDTTNGTNENGNNFYNCLDPKTSTITKGAAANLFMSGNTMTLTNFTGEVHYSMAGTGTDYATKAVDSERTSYAYDLNTGGYRGTFATYTGTAPTAKTLICDDTGAPAFTAANNKVYYPATAADANRNIVTGDQVYKVGYAKVNIMHSQKDLAAGMNMTNYGNDRWTNKLYATDGTYRSAYYDIVGDPNGYILDFGKDSNFVNVWDTELYATVLATTDGEGDTVLIIGLDAQTHSTDVAAKVKRMVSLATGVPQDNISVSSDHIHCAPAAGTSYVTYTGTDGKEHNTLDDNGRAIVKADYATTFYSGVVTAAVQALKNQEQVESISVGTLDTAVKDEDGNTTTRYNFTRNVELWSGDKQIGMLTDNYSTHFYSTNLLYGSGYIMPGGTGTQATDRLNKDLHVYEDETELKYESEADDDLQLVQYVTVGGGKIIMTNFQTHPHLGSGSDSYYVHSDVVGAFRAWLEDYTGAGVIYFSGGGGNVNTTTKIDDDESQYPYYQNLQDGKYAATQVEAYLQAGTNTKNTPLTRVCKANDWGYSLATAANEFLNGSGNMTVVLSSTVSGSRDVEVKVTEYSGTRQVNKASDTAIAKAAKIRDWTTGSYKSGFVSFSEYSTWSTFVTADYTNKEDNVYSSFAATRIRQRLLWEENGKTTYKMNLTAYAMGEIGFIAAPYEMFHENGTQIKQGSAGEGKKYAMTIVATLANGSNGYIPSAEGYANGGYSTDQTYFIDGTGEALAKYYVEMLNGLKK